MGIDQQSNQQPNLPFLDRFKWLILLFIGGLIALGLGFLMVDEPDPVTISIQPPLPTATHTDAPSPTPSQTPAPLEIYITGAVQNPESRLSLAIGSRVEDAIQAAGGVTENADLSVVNLAAVLQDGDQIHVPTKPVQASDDLSDEMSEEAANDEVLEETSEESQPASIAIPDEPNPTPTRSTPRLINLNTATAEELQTLPRIGPALAESIIAYREENGDFETIEAIMEVPRIGEATFEGFRDLITVDD